MRQKVKQAIDLLRCAGIPMGEAALASQSRQDRLAIVFLAVADLKPSTPWAEAKFHGDGNGFGLRSRDIIEFLNCNYRQKLSKGKKLSPGSYDDIRRKSLIFLVEAGIVLASADDPNADNNNPMRAYAISPLAARLLKSYGNPEWGEELEVFLKHAGQLRDRLRRERQIEMVPISLPSGKVLELSPGPHNKLQKAIIEEFLPRFAPGSKVLYIGDSTNKQLHNDKELVAKFGLSELNHELLPDVVAVYPEKGWLLMIEAVHSANPINQLRHLELERMGAKSPLGCVYVSAFKTRADFRKWITDLSWETEVWISDEPTHMIHMNGTRFLGPHP